MSEEDIKQETMRHSLAHIMATAVQHLWPDAKFGVGPAVTDGFYYDIDLGANKLSEEDFAKIEKDMRQIIKADQPFVHSTKTVDEAISWAQQNHQPYKVELLNDLKRSGTTDAKQRKCRSIPMATLLIYAEAHTWNQQER
jgi:threonyl-tRNA synthetase